MDLEADAVRRLDAPMTCADVHACVRTGRIPHGVPFIGTQDVDDQHQLLLFNCPRCTSTVSYEVTPDMHGWRGQVLGRCIPVEPTSKQIEAMKRRNHAL